MASLDEDRRRQLRRAISDPGAVLPRIFGDGESAHEMLPSWQTRAVEKVIGPWLAGQPEDEARPPGPLADFLAAVQLRVKNVRECPPDAPDALWRSVHTRSARDVPWLLAGLDAALRCAAEWEETAAEMNATAERLAAGPGGQASFLAGAEAYADCARELREAIRALLKEAPGA